MPAPQPVVQPPTGRRPSHANDQAPLPKLGPLISSLLKPGAGGQRYSAPIQPQAGVVPPPGPNPPAPGIPQPPNANQLQPNAAPVPPQPAPPPPRLDRGGTDVAGRLGDRTGRPQQDPAAFRHLRDRPRDRLGQRRSRQPSGPHGVRRHIRLLQGARPAMAIQRAVPQLRPRSVPRNPHRRRRAERPILRLTGVDDRAFPNRSSTPSTRRRTRRASFRPPPSP